MAKLRLTFAAGDYEIVKPIRKASSMSTASNW